MDSADDQVSKKSLLLKPEEANLADLFRFLISGDIESKEFIQCLQAKETSLKRRFLIFISVAVQKALQSMATPLQLYGSMAEFCLNFIANNYEILPLLRGNLIVPARDSALFVSALGHLDRRVDLDKKIKTGDNKYFGFLSAMASKLSYENRAFIRKIVEDQWKMDLVGVYDFRNEYQKKNTTQAIIIHDKNVNPGMIIVAFRGTEPFNSDDWCTDFDISWHKFQNMGKVHSGFMKALGLQNDESWPPNIADDTDNPVAYYTIREVLRKKFQQSNDTKFIVTGHSLGGALAVLFPAVLSLHNETSILERLEAIYTFGQPRVGNKNFGNYMRKQFKQYGTRYYRFVYNNDIVPRLPYENTTLLFRHFGECLYYDSLYEGQKVKEEPSKNYFTLSGIVTKRVDALWEIVRSFILPWRFGREYREGLPLLGLRLLGLLIPGLPEHCMHDYINAIRLGRADLFR